MTGRARGPVPPCRPSTTIQKDDLENLYGKTVVGKSSLAETIFGEEVFKINHTVNPGTSECQRETREINGRNITLIDTPGFFDNRRNEEGLKPETAKCITECPHAFLILLKVEKFTEHEKEVVSKIKQSFSEEAFKYAVVVFTHGDQLPEGMTIEEFVSENKDLRDLLEKCGGRCHVVDNKYWKNNQQHEYRNNQIQVGNLLNTITEMVKTNSGGFYTNKMLQAVNRLIQEEERRIQSSSGHVSQEEIKSQAKKNVFNFLKKAAGITTGVLLGALLGVPVMVALVVRALKAMGTAEAEVVKVAVVTAAGGTAAAAASGVVAGIAAGAALTGAAAGGYTGYCEADKSDSAVEAVMNTATAVGELAAELIQKSVKYKEKSKLGGQ
ncbi:GTPase IMAP family member 7-like [Odontesthes bonariensis]|uniref:GTPase IMAP family member 7-like n=1 Tax=Odontesthes bonariensis TaxID=219752 RepID=UPI003F58271B